MACRNCSSGCNCDRNPEKTSRAYIWFLVAFIGFILYVGLFGYSLGKSVVRREAAGLGYGEFVKGGFKWAEPASSGNPVEAVSSPVVAP